MLTRQFEKGMGAEAVSLNAKYVQAEKFRRSGYANITSSATYTGGVVRQYGRLSFSRVFDAGHTGMLALLRHYLSQKDVHESNLFSGQCLRPREKPSTRSSCAPCLTRTSQQVRCQRYKTTTEKKIHIKARDQRLALNSRTCCHHRPRLALWHREFMDDKSEMLQAFGFGNIAKGVLTFDKNRKSYWGW